MTPFLRIAWTVFLIGWMVMAVIAAVALTGCSFTRKEVQYNDPERCGRVYAPEVVRMKHQYLDAGEKIENALLFERLSIMQDREPRNLDLDRIVEEAVGFIYTAGRNLSDTDLSTTYTQFCVWSLTQRQ